MKTIAIFAAALLALVILRRHREPVAVAWAWWHRVRGHRAYWRGSEAACNTCDKDYPVMRRPLIFGDWEFDDLQPSDPYPASVLR